MSALDDLDFPTPVYDLAFDEFGLPVGDVATRVWSHLTEEMLTRVEPLGWDQPGLLLALLKPEASAAHVEAAAPGRRAEIDDKLAAMGNGPMIPMTVVTLGEVHGHPSLALQGVTAPDDALAVMLIFEAWSAPYSDDLTPAEHPERVEVRSAMLLDRAGRVFMRVLVRDNPELTTSLNDVTHAPGSESNGMIEDCLRRVLGMPVNGQVRPPAWVLAAHTMTMSGTVLVQIAEHLAQAGIPLSELVSDDPVVDDPQWRGYSTGIIARNKVMWEATGHGRHAVEGPTRKVLRNLAMGRMVPSMLTEAQRNDVDDVAEALARSSWTELLGTKAGRNLVPEEVRDAIDTRWSGDALTASMVFRHMAGPQAVYDWLVETVGADIAAGVADAVSCWWTPEGADESVS